MKESELQSVVIDLLNAFNWRFTHFRPAMRQSGRWSTPISGHAGYPDITATKNGAILFIELKSEKGRIRPDQHEWLNDLSINPHIEAYVLRPGDIDALTRRLSGDIGALAHRRLNTLH
jgi:hypothetical protein